MWILPGMEPTGKSRDRRLRAVANGSAGDYDLATSWRTGRLGTTEIDTTLKTPSKNWLAEWVDGSDT